MSLTWLSLYWRRQKSTSAVAKSINAANQRRKSCNRIIIIRRYAGTGSDGVIPLPPGFGASPNLAKAAKPKLICPKRGGSSQPSTAEDFAELVTVTVTVKYDTSSTWHGTILFRHAFVPSVTAQCLVMHDRMEWKGKKKRYSPFA